MLKDGESLIYLRSRFPKLSEAKLKDGFFTGSDKQKPLSEAMWEKWKEVWNFVKKIVCNVVFIILYETLK